MDLGIKNSGRTGYAQRDKRCLSCNKVLEKDGSHLYGMSFCSEDCRDIYMGRTPEPARRKEHKVLFPEI
jgi:hypothetical protein